MRSGKFLLGLMTGVSFFVLPAPATAQTADGPNIVMRRPLPNQRVTSTQDSCTTTGTCPTPVVTDEPTTTPTEPVTPVTPTPPVVVDPSPSPTGDPVCPDGHICSPPPIEPQTSDSVYGWYVHCDKPQLANCERITEVNPGKFNYETVDESFCAAPQSDAANAVVAREGTDRIPGVFYDFTEMCPGSGGGTPTPTTTPGCMMDPSLVADPGSPPPFETGIYQWLYGPWSSNGAPCGAQTTEMQRGAICGMIVPDFSPPGGGGEVSSLEVPNAPGASVAMRASYAPGKSPIGDGVYRPGMDGAKLMKVQFGPGMENVFVIPVPASFCAGQPAACNSYTGTNANCTYESKTNEVQTAEWTLPDGAPGTASCSSFAQRVVSRTCLDASGATVDDGFCANNVVNGGQQNYAYSNTVQTGNYSGCTARWVGIGEDLGCSADGVFANGGPTHYADYSYRCVRSDGKILDRGVPEAACTGPKPSDGVKSVGTCSKSFEWSWSNTCINVGNGSGYNYGYEQLNALGLQHKTVVFEGTFNSGGLEACEASGATCCAERENNDDSGPLRGQMSVIGTDNEPHEIYGRYIDSDVAAEIAYGSNSYLPDGSVLHDVCVQYMLDEDWYGLPAGTILSSEPYGVRHHMMEDGDGGALVRQCDPSTRYWSLNDGHAYFGRGGGTRYTQDSYDIPNDDPDPDAAPPGSDGGGNDGPNIPS